MTALYAVRSAITWLLGIPLTMGYASVVWIVATIRPNSPRLDPLVRSWSRSLLRVAGVKLTVNGLENVDPSTSYVVVSNHVSGFDIMSHFAALPVPIRFLAKTELFKIPIFGRAMRSIGIVEVDRGAGRSIHEHINTTATDAVAKGRSLIIYPEGTRPRDGQMKQFKKGAFTIATSMQLPILPAPIVGSRAVWPPGGKIIRPGHVTVTILPSVPTDGMGPSDVDALRSKVHAQVAEVASQKPEDR